MKPRLLLVNPPVFDFTAFDFWLKPYGLLQVAGFLRGQADMSLFDYLDRSRMPETAAGTDQWGRGKFTSSEIPKPAPLRDIPRRYHRFGLKRELFRKFITDNEPFDFALVQTVMTYWYPGVSEAIADIRELAPLTKIVLGGVYPTLCPNHAQQLEPDLCIRGNTLQPLWNLIGLHPDLNQPPLWEAYCHLETAILKISDGCPFACTYCSVPGVYGQFTPRPAPRCLAEFAHLRQTGVRNIAFYDDALLFDAQHVITPFLTALPTTDISLHTPNALNARFITEPLAKTLINSGFKTFHLGFESLAPEWQTRTGGKIRGEELATAVSALKDAGANPNDIHAYIIVGHPDHATQQVEESMEYAHNLGIQLMLSEFSPVPGTPDGDRCNTEIDPAEPLHQNKTAFAIRALGETQVQKLKLTCRTLNSTARQKH